jgi:hypothetical protein
MAIIDMLNLIEFDFIRSMVRLFSYYVVLNKEFGSSVTILTGVEKIFGQVQAQGFLNFFNPSPVSNLPSPNL